MRRRANGTTPERALLSSALLALAVSCGGDARPRGVILIAIDGLRPEALAPREGADEPSALAELAHGAVLFDDAWTPAPLEVPALASLLTGLDPRRHGARDDGTTAIGPDVRNLAQILADDGFRARAAVSSEALAPGSGIERGFETFDAPAPSRALFRVGFDERRGERTMDRALADLNELVREDAPFLLLIHLCEPRAPFAPPDVSPSASEAARYAGEVRTVDHQLRRLLSALEGAGVANDLLLVVTAPRAVALPAVAGAETGENLDPQVMHVPLLVRAPGRSSANEPVHVSGPVSLIDVAPTVLALLGVPPPAGLGELDGRSLLPAIEAGATEPGRVLALESWHPWLSHGLTPLAGVVRDDLRLVRGATTSMRAGDSPTELFRAQDARSRDMAAELERRFGPPDPAWPAAETAADEHGTYLPRLAAAEDMLRAGTLAPARAHLDELEREAPGDPTVARHLATLLVASAAPTAADVERAEPLVERALELRPDDAYLNELLARCAAARESVARRVLTVAERNGSEDAAREARALVRAQHERRVAALERALARTPESEQLRAELERARLDD